MHSADGAVSLAELRGRVVPIYFGYMNCPDICPMTLSVLGTALRALDEGELQTVQALFISLDPQRDDLPRLSEYARYFHPRIEGVTGSPAELAEVARRYRVVATRVPVGGEDQYTLDHTSRLALVDRNGRLARMIPDGMPPPVITEAIRGLLSQ